MSDVGIWPGGTLSEVGVTFFFGRGRSQSWGHRGVLGKGASHRGAPGSFAGVTQMFR
jgi:hypothetical protein